MDLHINLNRNQNIPHQSVRYGQKAGQTYNNDVVSRSQQKTKSLVNQVMRKAVKMESSFTDLIDKHARSIATNKKTMDESHANYKAALEQKSALIQEYELSEEDAALLDRAQTIDRLSFTEEEQERLKELRQNPNIQDYESQISVINENIGHQRSQLNEAIQNIKLDTKMIEAVKQEHLKVNVMGTANREIEDIKNSAAKELVGDLISQAKDNLDEQMEELKEKQAAQKEDEEKQKELQEKKEEREAQVSSQTEAADPQDISQKMADSDALLAETEAAVTEINEKLKKLEELLTGTSVNTYA